MIKINHDLVKGISQDAKMNDRKRKNFNFHPAATDPMHRMIHASNPGTYVQPHKHESPDKTEAFIILKGKVVLIEFDDNGNIIDHFIMQANTANYGVEIPPRTWHMLITLQENSLFYEVKNGPWDLADDKFFAPWSPAEGDPDCKNYISSILKELHLYQNK